MFGLNFVIRAYARRKGSCRKEYVSFQVKAANRSHFRSVFLINAINPSKHVITLGYGELIGWIAGESLTVNLNFIRLGVDGDLVVRALRRVKTKS